MVLKLHPYTRITILTVGIIGTVICKDLFLLLGFWLVILIPVMVALNLVKIHIKLLLITAVPMFLMLGILNVFLLQKGWDSLIDISTTILKLIVYTSIIQIVFVIPLNYVLYTFRMWGLRGDALITTLGSYIVWVDVVERALKIVTARYARGYVAKRSVYAGIKQIPSLLIPLIIGILRTSQVRAESWEQKNIFYRLTEIECEKIKLLTFINISVFIIMLLWLIANILL